MTPTITLKKTTGSCGGYSYDTFRLSARINGQSPPPPMIHGSEVPGVAYQMKEVRRTRAQAAGNSASARLQVAAVVSPAVRERSLAKGISITRLTKDAHMAQAMIHYLENGARKPTIGTSSAWLMPAAPRRMRCRKRIALNGLREARRPESGRQKSTSRDEGRFF